MSRERITSVQNPLMQLVRRLQASRAFREKNGLFVGDGSKLLAEAVRWWKGLETVIVSENTELPCALPEQVRVIEVPASLMQRISQMQTPQGVLFLCRMPEPEPLRISGGSLILDGIQDPGNLGTILRTADALEVPVVLTEGCADPYGPKTVRASMGSVFRTVPQTALRARVMDACTASGVRLAVTSMDLTACDIRTCALRDAAVVVGSEGQGVCAEFLERSEQKIIIPMNSRCESLNAAVASAIIMWQMKLE